MTPIDDIDLKLLSFKLQRPAEDKHWKLASGITIRVSMVLAG